ncbi:MAG TPA: transglycosylase SLT domain-containing protein [Nitrospirota bacterium]|nr:transglycosylase SLT domain-containing protein [Nitrospirota bacterium]
MKKAIIIILIVLLKVSQVQAQEGSIPIDPYLNAIGDSFFSNLPGLNLPNFDLIDTEDFNNTPVYATRKVASYLRYFATDGRDTFQKWLDQSGPYLFHIKEILREEGLPEELALLPLIESGFNVNARSPKRALGLWQFMAATGAMYGLRVDKWVDERKDPIKSTRAAAKHLKDLYNEFGTWPLALASYNAGSGKVRRALATTGASTFWEMGQSRALKAETRNYVPKFMAALIIAKNPDVFGFNLPEEPVVKYDLVEVPGGMDLHAIAKMANVSYQSLRGLNPWIKGHITPFGEPYHTLSLPEGAGSVLLENFGKLLPAERIVYREYKVSRGDTVYQLARRYDTTAIIIKRINNLSKRYTIIPGDSILIPDQHLSDEGEIRLVATSPDNVQPDT